MRSVASLDAAEARALVGVLFDLDDTVLDHGQLTLAAYGALWKLRDAGLRLVAVTGRPYSWADVVARTWPVDAAIAENGAVAIVRESGRVVVTERASATERGERSARLKEIVAAASRELPEVGLADDVAGRLTDVTWDIGEHVTVPEAQVSALMALIQRHGARTTRSSVHVHATFEVDDKATGVTRMLCETQHEDATAARHRWAYVGDSANDAPCFSAFRSTFGVANVRGAVARLSVPPRWVASRERGAGFAEIADALVRARGGPVPSGA
ncbi:MAG: HAD-IIB family hydrolase [Polyangiaceae bacterium]